MTYLGPINYPALRRALLPGVLYLLAFFSVFAVGNLPIVSALLVIPLSRVFRWRIGLVAVLLTLLAMLNVGVAQEAIVPGLIVLALVSALLWDVEKKLELAIVERKRAEEALRHAQQQTESHQRQLSVERERLKLLEQVISDISHDLKAPLSVISASIYLLEKLNDPEKQKKKIETIKTQTVRLERLIQDILTSAKLDRLHELTFKPLDFNAMILNVGKGFAPKAEAKNITFTLDLDADELVILANENSLHRALVNLVENALNYTPDGGNIVIQSYVQGNNAVAEIRDTGIGIAASELPYIFDRFYRAHNGRGVQSGGSGLGLAISKKVVELHGGSIQVESECGQGTVFTVLLPRMKDKRLHADNFADETEYFDLADEPVI